MSTTWLLLNAAYATYAISGLFKDMLKLRIVLVIATVFFISWGFADGIWSAVWWNTPVGLVHLWQIWLLLKARIGIDLDDEAEAIRTLIFNGMDRVDFNTLWHAGTERSVSDGVLITKGHEVNELMLILDGEVEVAVSDDYTVRLSQYRLLGEMSSLTRAAASATVTPLGTVRLRAWDKDKLATLAAAHPTIDVALLRAMGQDVSRKLS